jgi:Domain of unknown function (DUF4412)
MKTTVWSLALSAFFLLPVRADLTIVYSTTLQPVSQTQKPGESGAGTNMTIKIKGEKARIEASPQLTTIFDGTRGEVINLMNDQKTVVRISPEKMKAVADMLNKFSSKKPLPETPKLTPTGHKEIVNGYETEQFTYDGPDFKAIYWVAPTYPNGAAILAQLQSIKSEFWDAMNTKMPDFRDFPGLPIRTQLIMAKLAQEKKPGTSPSGHATEITSSITSVNQNPISDSEFTVPGDYKEAKLPDIFGERTEAPSVSPSP